MINRIGMIENIGFSYVGLLFILMLVIPNIIWIKNQPRNYSPNNENKILLFLERIGQVCVTTVALSTKSFNIQEVNSQLIWLLIAFAIMVIYEFWWARYFKSDKKLADFYSNFLGIPVAGATLPVVAFFILGIYGKSIAMLIAVIILGIGHIGIHLQHRASLTDKN